MNEEKLISNEILSDENITEISEEMEIQTTFNEDTIEELIDPEDCVIENVDSEEPEGIGAGENFTMRTNKPGAGNKFYNTKSKGGYSTCIQGKPTDANCNVLANCVGYACGRFNEIIGSMKYPSLNCNAENFIERAKNTYGLQVVNYPTLGGIMVWQKGDTLNGGDGAGHVAVVERIDSANLIYTSESGYGSSAFWNSIRKNDNGRWGLSAGYKFRGCIVNPAIGDVHYTNSTNTNPFPNVSDEELAKRVWNGEFGNGDERRKKLGSRYDAVQALVDKGVGKPSTSSTPTTPETTKQYDLLTMVKKTIRGDFGNYPQRKKEIEKLGYDYKQVQDQVNANIKHGLTRWDNIKLF